MMSEQDVPSTSGVMESLKNVGDISMAVTSIARLADAKGPHTSKGGEQSNIDATNLHSFGADSNKDKASIGLENTKKGKEDVRGKSAENGTQIGVGREEKESEKKRREDGKTSLKYNSEEFRNKKTDDKKVQKMSEDVSMKIVESGSQVVAINQELMKTKTREQHAEEIKGKDFSKGKGEKYLDSRNQDIPYTSLANTTGGIIRQATKDTNIETIKQKTNGKQRNDLNHKIKDESNVAMKVIESGKQLIDINNELTNQKTVNSETNMSKKQHGVKNSIDEFGNTTKINTNIKEDDFLSNKKDKMLNSKETKPMNNKEGKRINSNEDKMMNSKEGDNLENKKHAHNSLKPEVNEENVKKNETIEEPFTGPKQGPGLIWSVLDDNRLRDRFQLYSMVGDRLSDGTSIRLSQSDKWFKEAGIINKEGFSTTDTDIAFRKISKKAQKINFVDWIGFLENLASAKNCDVKDIKNKLVECEGPHSIGTTKLAPTQNRSVTQSRSAKSNGKKTRSNKEWRKETGKVPWRY